MIHNKSLSEMQLEHIEVLRLALLGKLVETTGEIYKIRTIVDCLSYKFIVSSCEQFTATSMENLRISTFDNGGTIIERIEANANVICKRIKYQRLDSSLDHCLEIADIEIERLGWVDEKLKT